MLVLTKLDRLGRNAMDVRAMSRRSPSSACSSLPCVGRRRKALFWAVLARSAMPPALISGASWERVPLCALAAKLGTSRMTASYGSATRRRDDVPGADRASRGLLCVASAPLPHFLGLQRRPAGCGQRRPSHDNPPSLGNSVSRV